MPVTHKYSYLPDNDRISIDNIQRLYNDITTAHNECDTNNPLTDDDIIKVISMLLPESTKSDKLADIRAIGRYVNTYFITDERLLEKPFTNIKLQSVKLANIMLQAVNVRLTSIQSCDNINHYHQIINKVKLIDQRFQELEEEKQDQLAQVKLYEDTVKTLKQGCARLKRYLDDRWIKNNSYFHKKIKVEEQEPENTSCDVLLYKSVCNLINILDSDKCAEERVREFNQALARDKKLYEKDYDTMLCKFLKVATFGISIFPLVMGTLGEDDEQKPFLIQTYRSLFKHRGAFFMSNAISAIAKISPVEIELTSTR